RDQVARELGRRRSLGVPVAAGGVLYLLGSITIAGTLKGAPTVGLIQGLTPALKGEVNPAVSPRAQEVKFISHHAFALLPGSVVVSYVDLLAGLAFAAGMISVMVNALRVGLLPRWLAILGMFAAVLIFLPLGGAELEIIPAFWLVATGILLLGRWPGGDPPAW